MRDTDSPHNPTVADDCLHGGGEMVLSKAQIVLFWGPDLIALYNDAYRPVFGAKHPWALSQPARECWREVWDVLRPLFEGVMRNRGSFLGARSPLLPRASPIIRSRERRRRGRCRQ